MSSVKAKATQNRLRMSRAIACMSMPAPCPISWAIASFAWPACAAAGAFIGAAGIAGPACAAGFAAERAVEWVCPVCAAWLSGPSGITAVAAPASPGGSPGVQTCSGSISPEQ